MYLHTRYIPTLARTVVMSKVPSAATTSSREERTVSLSMTTSVCSLPMYSATRFAYLRSIASVLIPIAKVRMGLPRIRADTAHTRLLSSPPESRKPIGASASSRFSMPATSFSLIEAVTRSMPSGETPRALEMSS